MVSIVGKTKYLFKEEEKIIIKPFEPLEINEDICEICYASLVNKKISCKRCNMKICLNCFNKLPSRSIGTIENDEIEDTITKEYIYGQDIYNQGLAQPYIKYECSFCRKENMMFIISFMNSYDITSVILQDYLKLTLLEKPEIIKNNNIETLKKELIQFDNIAGYATAKLLTEQQEHNETKKELLKLQEENKEIKEKYNKFIDKINKILMVCKNKKVIQIINNNNY